MTFTPSLRRGVLALALLLLLGITWTGFNSGFDQLHNSISPGQKFQTFCQFAYGVFGLASAATIFWSRLWGPLVQWCWMVSVALAGGVASVAWGGTNIWIGLIAGGASFLVGALVIWLLRVGGRDIVRA